MFLLRAEHSFDAAHFLYGYDGKCANLHGHHWRVVVEVQGPALQKQGQMRDMLVDFGVLKRDLKEVVDFYDHCVIAEEGRLMPQTVDALRAEHFRLVYLPYRPTAERLAQHFYTCMEKMGYSVRQVSVYETPENCAIYTGEEEDIDLLV